MAQLMPPPLISCSSKFDWFYLFGNQLTRVVTSPAQNPEIRKTVAAAAAAAALLNTTTLSSSKVHQAFFSFSKLLSTA